MSKTSNPQKRRRSSQNRPIFVPNLAAGGAGADLVSGVDPVCVKSGVTYGIDDDGNVIQFAVNKIPLEKDGLRGCPAFTQYFLKTRTLTDAIWKPGTGVSVTGSNKIVYNGTGVITKGIDQQPTIAGGTASKIFTVVALVSADTYPQTFRLKNTHGGVVDNFSPDKTIYKPEKVYLRVVNAATAGTGLQIGGIAPSTTNSPFEIYMEMNLAEANFIYPYSPNDTTSTVSYVSEAATATTGTSFDLDNALLARLKTALRGPNAQGHLELTFKSNIDSGWLANSSVYNILSVNNTAASLLYINKDSGGAVTVRTTDGTNVASVTQGLVVGSSYKIAVDWGTHSTGQKIRITANGVKSSLVDCGVSLGAEYLSFFDLSGIHIGWIVKDSLKISNRPQW